MYTILNVYLTHIWISYSHYNQQSIPTWYPGDPYGWRYPSASAQWSEAAEYPWDGKGYVIWWMGNHGNDRISWDMWEISWDVSWNMMRSIWIWWDMFENNGMYFENGDEMGCWCLRINADHWRQYGINCRYISILAMAEFRRFKFGGGLAVDWVFVKSTDWSQSEKR